MTRSPFCSFVRGTTFGLDPKHPVGTKQSWYHTINASAGFNRPGLCSSSIGKFLSASTRELDTELAQPMWLLWELTHWKKIKSQECQISSKKE